MHVKRKVQESACPYGHEHWDYFMPGCLHRGVWNCNSGLFARAEPSQPLPRVPTIKWSVKTAIIRELLEGYLCTMLALTCLLWLLSFFFDDL